MIRLLVLSAFVLLAALGRAGPVPPELESALARFRSEGTPGWAFTQTTASAGSTLVERFDPAQPEFRRWVLLQKDGRTPTADEAKDYAQRIARQARGETAPNVKDQIQRDTCEPLGIAEQRARYRFRLKAGGEDDKSAAHMGVTFSLHLPTGTIERVELASLEAFAPMFGVKIAEARTVIDYSLPTPERPTLLQAIAVRVRGRAMLIKSLDRDMTVTYADYAPSAPATSLAAPPPASAPEKPKNSPE